MTSLPFIAANTTDSLLISSGTFATKLYYFDTRSSESYGILQSSRPIIGLRDHARVADRRSIRERAAHVRSAEPNRGPFGATNFIAGATTPVRQM